MQGVRTLPEGLRSTFEGTDTHLRSTSTPQSASPFLPGASTPLQDASTPLQDVRTPPRNSSALVQGANSTPQGASTPLPSVASSPIVAQLTATRSPSLLTAKSRKRERLEDFFKGKARAAAYRLSPDLDGSLSSSDTLLTGVQAIDGTSERCQRGCTEILR